MISVAGTSEGADETGTVGAVRRAAAQIHLPGANAKIRPGDVVDVIVTVAAPDDGRWQVAFVDDRRASVQVLAEGSGEVRRQRVATIGSDVVAPGSRGTLRLEVSSEGSTAEARTQILGPDPTYVAIPVDEGNMSRRRFNTYGVSADGGTVFFSPVATDPPTIELLDRRSGRRRVIEVSSSNSSGFQISANGSRLYYPGFFDRGSGIGFFDMDLGAEALVAERGLALFSLDNEGDGLALQRADNPGGLRHYVKPPGSAALRMVSGFPGVIEGDGDCLASTGTTPLITDDGGRVYFISQSTLGLSGDDPGIGCRVYRFEVATGSVRQVSTLPSNVIRVTFPSISGDGRWLAFTAIPVEKQYGVSFLIDTETGEVESPVMPTEPWTTFDTVVTRDGEGLVLSSRADLDPRVGNSDHNLELFYVDRRSRVVDQISETVGGVGATPSGCITLKPQVSEDGGVVMGWHYQIDAEGCRLDGPQRSESTGFMTNFYRAVRKRPGNSAVRLDSVADPVVVGGATLDLEFAAHDADGDPISFFAQLRDGLDVPRGSVVTDHHDGTASFVWQTRPEDVGTHVLRVAAFDEGGGEVFHDVTISVVPRLTVTCPGDCGGDGSVTVEEVLTVVGVALGSTPVTACRAADADANGSVSVDEVVAAVDHALRGCAGGR